jgi:CHAT domain-containing protein
MSSRLDRLQSILLACVLAGLGIWPTPTAGASGESGSGSPASRELALADRSMSDGAAGFARGDFERAVTGWGEAARLYGEADSPRFRHRALIRLSDAYQALGAYDEAIRVIGEAVRVSQGLGDKALIASDRGALGNLYIVLASSEDARRELEASVALAREAEAPETAAATLINLGNHFAIQRDYPAAAEAYAESVEIAAKVGDAALAARALANWARAALEGGELEAAQKLLEQSYERLEPLEASHDKAYLLISLARSTDRLRAVRPAAASALLLRSHQLLVEADAAAAKIGDARASAFALGYMGTLYEQERHHEEALELTRRAIFQSQKVAGDASGYLWHAQAARLHSELGDRDAAIGQYETAVDLVQGMRHTLAVGYGSSKTSFRDDIAPIYFALVDLLLQRARDRAEPARAQRDLEGARQTLELLKAAELRDYFRDECVDLYRGRRVSLEQAAASAAVIYPILLRDRIELLVSGRDAIEQVSVPVGATRVTEEIRSFRRTLERRTTREYLAHARQLHRWLIEPIEEVITSMGADTLVFVPDAALRTIPMSALHDGDRFLIQRFAIAVTPSLELTDPRPLDRTQMKLFLGGLSEGVQGFPPLPHVAMELESIQSLHGGELLIDDRFVVANVEEKLSNREFSVVHIASHAEFGEQPRDTFVLTHEGRLSMEQLSDYVGYFQFRDTPLELLVLSACETAEGSDRAALGLSGVAIKAGARSALGTLWSVNDVAASQIVIEFYRQLQDPQISRAAALQRAQVPLLDDHRYRHPGYWAAFVLLNNWL